MKENKLYTLKQKRNEGNTLFTAFQQDREPFDIEGQGLYAWVPRRYFDDMIAEGGDFEDVKEWIKFGQYGADAENGKSPEVTIESYTGTTVDEIVVIWAKRLTDDEIEANGSAKKVEGRVNKRIGVRKNSGKSTEVFHTTLRTIKTEVNKVLYGVDKKESYKPRKPQRECIDRMVDAYLAGETEFLLGAIMRFGKNFTFLQLVAEVSKRKKALAL